MSLNWIYHFIFLAFLTNVLVIFADGSTNLALGKPTKQSSTYYIDENVVTSSYAAVDGDTNPYFLNNSCTHSSGFENEWWEVDLLGFYFIQTISIVNREDCCGYRLRNFTIFTYVENSAPSECITYTEPVANGETISLHCGNVTPARYVKIFLPQGFLTLCEVMVFGCDAKYSASSFHGNFGQVFSPSAQIEGRFTKRQCSLMCNGSPTCFGFNYLNATQQCHLVSFLFPTSTQLQSWVFYQRKPLLENTQCSLH